jgi:acyl-CoA thioesterase FadM
MFNNFFFFQKSLCLWDNVEKYGIASQATYVNIIRRMRSACWTTKVQMLRICVLIAFHDNYGHANAPSYYVYTYIACLVFMYLTPDSMAFLENLIVAQLARKV